MKEYDVAICGYGPVGAVLSILLAQYGHTVCIIEKNNGPSPTARAINTDAEQLRVFDKFGIANMVVENSNQIDRVHFSDVNLQPIQTIDQPKGDSKMGWPNQVLFYQPELESFLRDTVSTYKNIDVIESCELIDFLDDQTSVNLMCKKQSENFEIKAKYLIGCDGASSFVRKKLKIQLEDLGYNQKWLVCDAHLTKDINLKNELIQVCDPKRPCTFLHGRRGHLRFEFRVMPNDNEEDFKNEEIIWDLLSPWVNKNNAFLERAVIYKFHACIANEWFKDKVLIAGDAAHQMPPFMGAGMGTGIRDVANIAWKLDLILQNKASKKILTTFKEERYPHAKWTVAQTITIGEIIEGFCAAAEGKEYKPKSTGYGVRFPHIPKGIFSNPDDRITGYPIPQPRITIDKKTVMLDEVIRSKFVIITKCDSYEISKEAKDIVDYLAIEYLHLSDDDDPDGRLNKIFETYQFVLVRPDLYVYGGSSKNDLSKMIVSLKSMFSLMNN